MIQVISNQMHGLMFAMEDGLIGHFLGDKQYFFALKYLHGYFKVNALIGVNWMMGMVDERFRRFPYRFS